MPRDSGHDKAAAPGLIWPPGGTRRKGAEIGTTQKGAGMKIAAIGTGGADRGCVARFILSGHDVALCDPAPGAAGALDDTISRARLAWQDLFQAPLPAPGRLIPAPDMARALAGAGYIHAGLPLTPELLAQIETAAPPAAIIAATAPGEALFDLRRIARHPERILSVNFGDPAYLIPGVEIIGGGAAADRAAELLAATGMQPVQIPREIAPGPGARLRRALCDEALALVHDGAATTAQIDQILCAGLGPTLTEAGLFQSLRPDARDSDSDSHSGKSRDATLVALLQALRLGEGPAGRAIAAQENAFYARAPVTDAGYPLRLHHARVPASWLDYNGHMTEFRYLQVMGDATDAFLIHIGMGPDYRATGHSAYTVETHIRHLSEVGMGELLQAETRLLGHDGKRIRLHHSLRRESGAEVATGEHMLLHVDSTAGRACPLPPMLLAALDRIAGHEARHEAGPHPDHAGRGIRATGAVPQI